MACRFLEGDDSGRTYRLGRSTYRGNWISQVVQDVAADCGIEQRTIRKRIVGRDHKFDISISGHACPGPGHLDRSGFAVESKDTASRAHRVGQKHGYVADAAADVEHAHPGPNAAFPDQPPGDAGDDVSLELEPFDLKVCVTQNVGRRDVHWSTHPLCLLLISG